MSQQKMIKPKINEAIIVEGRDDESIVSRAIDAMIIVTHGFGIKKETWNLIDKAYKEKGIIIFTDPDHGRSDFKYVNYVCHRKIHWQRLC